MPAPTSNATAKRAGRATNRRRAHFVGKLQSKRKARREIQRSGSTQATESESDSIADDRAHQEPIHSQDAPYEWQDPASTLHPIQSGGDGLAGIQGPSPLAEILLSLLGSLQPGGPGGSALGGGGSDSLVNTSAMMGLPQPGVGGPSSMMGGGGLPQGLAQANQSSGGHLGLAEKIQVLAQLRAEQAEIHQDDVPVTVEQQSGPTRYQIPARLPADETFQQNPLSASILDMLAVVHSLRDLRGLQLDVEGCLAMRLEELGDSETEANVVKPNLQIFQQLLEMVRDLTEKQLEILDAFAKKAEGTIDAIKKGSPTSTGSQSPAPAQGGDLEVEGQ